MRNLNLHMHNPDRSIRKLNRSMPNLDRFLHNLDRSMRSLDRSMRTLDRSIRNLEPCIRNMHKHMSVVSITTEICMQEQRRRHSHIKVACMPRIRRFMFGFFQVREGI